jgi:hypothetical protein
VDGLSADIKGAPKGLSKTYPYTINIYFDDLRSKEPLAKLLMARTLELTVISKANKDSFPSGVYARWDFFKSLKELRYIGDLDRACQMMLGSDCISLPPAKAKIPVLEKKKGDEKQEKK